MTKLEAEDLAEAYNKYDHLHAEVTRIVPDEIQPGDNGWDVRITYLYESHSKSFED